MEDVVRLVYTLYEQLVNNPPTVPPSEVAAVAATTATGKGRKGGKRGSKRKTDGAPAGEGGNEPVSQKFNPPPPLYADKVM